MELVAATKMHRAVTAVLATRRYNELSWELLHEVQRRADVVHHPLLEGRIPERRSLALVIGGNRGLVGAFNQRIAARALDVVRRERVPTDIVTAGRVIARLVQRAGLPIIADFPKKDILAEPADAAPIAGLLLQDFLAGKVDRVRMVYTDYLSAVRQEVRVRTLLPVGVPSLTLGAAEDERASNPQSRRGRVDFLFEPSPTVVLQNLVPNLLSLQVYQALLETTASEHAARMVAMKQATDNAEELTDEMTLMLNQARQQQITRELQEIVSGALTAP